MNKDLNERLIKFASDVFASLAGFSKSSEMNVIRSQLAKRFSTDDANYEEAKARSSKPDFKNKVRISSLIIYRIIN